MSPRIGVVPGLFAAFPGADAVRARTLLAKGFTAAALPGCQLMVSLINRRPKALSYMPEGCRAGSSATQNRRGFTAGKDSKGGLHGRGKPQVGR